MDKTRHEFAEKMIRALRDAGVTGPIDFDEETFRLMVAPDGFVNLANAFAEWERAPRRRRQEILRRYASPMSLPEPPDDVELVRSSSPSCSCGWRCRRRSRSRGRSP
jgi:hypothetical protein